MRKAEEILTEKYLNQTGLCYNEMAKKNFIESIRNGDRRFEIEAINEARKEAIEESAKQIVPDGNPSSAKVKILSLIKELK